MRPEDALAFAARIEEMLMRGHEPQLSLTRIVPKGLPPQYVAVIYVRDVCTFAGAGNNMALALHEAYDKWREYIKE